MILLVAKFICTQMKVVYNTKSIKILILQFKGQKKLTMTTYLECDSIVDDHGFSKHIWGVLWIGQLSIQIEPEVGVIVHLLVS